MLVADLHLHSSYSDGNLTVSELINKVIEKKLKYFSITDHDTIDGIEAASNYVKDKDIYFIPGVEVSSEIDGLEIHILGYFIDYRNEELKYYLSKFKEERLRRAKQILLNLKKQGIDITIEDVIQFSESKPITRPHIAFALIKKKFVKNYREAFYKYLGDFSSAFEKKSHSKPNVVIELIRRCGGISVLAHPFNLSDGQLKQIILQGIDGIETDHPTCKNSRKKFLHKIAVENSLIETGGSDFHGGLRNDEHNFGKFGMTIDQIQKLYRYRDERRKKWL